VLCLQGEELSAGTRAGEDHGMDLALGALLE
jgi:hypothetical protein